MADLDFRWDPGAIRDLPSGQGGVHRLDVEEYLRFIEEFPAPRGEEDAAKDGVDMLFTLPGD